MADVPTIATTPAQLPLTHPQPVPTTTVQPPPVTHPQPSGPTTVPEQLPK